MPQRYSRPIPGDRVQMDVCRNGILTSAFFERVVEEMPFPIQRLQTDRGREFFALSVQQWLKHAAIKFRPIRPASPHLNGKVERSHQTHLAEFYAPQT